MTTRIVILLLFISFIHNIAIPDDKTHYKTLKVIIVNDSSSYYNEHRFFYNLVLRDTNKAIILMTTKIKGIRIRNTLKREYFNIITHNTGEYYALVDFGFHNLSFDVENEYVSKSLSYLFTKEQRYLKIALLDDIDTTISIIQKEENMLPETITDNIISIKHTPITSYYYNNKINILAEITGNFHDDNVTFYYYTNSKNSIKKKNMINKLSNIYDMSYMPNSDSLFYNIYAYDKTNEKMIVLNENSFLKAKRIKEIFILESFYKIDKIVKKPIVFLTFLGLNSYIIYKYFNPRLNNKSNIDQLAPPLR